MKLLPTDNINVIRRSIYSRLGVSHHPATTRSRKLRKVCSFACGLDLRRREHCVILAQHLELMARPSLPEVDVPSYEDLFAEATAKGGGISSGSKAPLTLSSCHRPTKPASMAACTPQALGFIRAPLPWRWDPPSPR